MLSQEQQRDFVRATNGGELGRVLERVPAAAYTTDAEGLITYYNEPAARLWGRSPGVSDPAERFSGAFRMLAPDGSVIEPESSWTARALRDHREYSGREIVIERPDGTRSTVLVHVNPIDDSHGELIGVVNLLLDITDRKRAESELAAQASRLRAVATTAFALGSSRSFERVVEVVTGEARVIVGTHLAISSSTIDDDWAQEVEAVSTSEQYRSWRIHEHQLPGNEVYGTVCRTGRALRFNQAELDAQPAKLMENAKTVGAPLRGWLAAPFLGRDGRGLGLLQVSAKVDGTDFTAEDESILVQLATIASIAIENAGLHDALREINRRKDEFLATLAHELRNPLAPIRNAVQVLRLAGPETPHLRWGREVIERQVEQLTRLIDDLLDVSRLTLNKLELRMERVDLADVIGSAVETSRPAIEHRAHELTVTLPARPVCLNADLIRLAQVFVNLLTNAAKYTDRRGRIWLTAERQGDEIVVGVKDTGIGIPAEKLSSLFEPFFQVDRSLERAHGGLGLGLSLVRQLVELHGGWVDARSAGLGRGSEFIVHLPALAEQPRSAEPIRPVRDPVASVGMRRILVVDDNRDSAESLALLLRLTGHEVAIGHDGLEALAKAESFRPDVVLLDLGMPKLNGYDACRRIRQQPWGENMVLIALTGWGQDADRTRTAAAGFTSHLVKPVDSEELMKLLASLAPERSSAD